MPRLFAESRPLPDPMLHHLHEDLQNLQGNILQPHGRTCVAYLFWHFASAAALRTWLRTCASQLTSAYTQLISPLNGTFRSLALSATGYQVLGLDPPEDASFRAGMKSRHLLGDPPVEKWEADYQQRIDAMLLLASDEDVHLREEITQQQASVPGGAEICAVEYGQVRRNTSGQSVEPFGYVDGRSQPCFFQHELVYEHAAEGTDQWNPAAGPSLVLVPDPHAVEPARQVASGSYLVFRKLAQNVCGFQAAIQHLARLTGQDEEYTYALVMGRFRDGTPLAMSQVAQGHNERIPNNFNFHGDPAGIRVPLQAHIRRMNPRGDYPRVYHMPSTYERGHRIVRRNVSYGSESNVGILFACYQCDIRRQYEFLQYNWANQPQVRSIPAGVDAIIGQGDADQDSAAHQWPTATGPIPFSFHGFVTCRGGEYFFVPSIPFLKSL